MSFLSRVSVEEAQSLLLSEISPLAPVSMQLKNALGLVLAESVTAAMDQPPFPRSPYLLLRLLGPNHPVGRWFLETFGTKLVMTWWSAIFATIVVAFPLMYRTARGAFESFDETLSDAGRTLGLSNRFIFWHVRMPYCKQGILAGAVLAFARALGEYGATSMVAGYTPGRTATISTTVYQLWRTGDDEGAMTWVFVNILISAVVLLSINLLEKRQKEAA